MPRLGALTGSWGTRHRLQVQPVLQRLKTTLTGGGAALLLSSVVLFGLIRAGSDENGIYGGLCRLVLSDPLLQCWRIVVATQSGRECGGACERGRCSGNSACCAVWSIAGRGAAQPRSRTPNGIIYSEARDLYTLRNDDKAAAAEAAAQGGRPGYCGTRPHLFPVSNIIIRTLKRINI